MGNHEQKKIDELIHYLETQNSVLKKVIEHMADKDFPYTDNEEDIRQIINSMLDGVPDLKFSQGSKTSV